ncbi:methyltransferase [Roseibium sp. RKSG952]|uniref:methyltransferase n=1 Tax=Roseibium sp. RKSG952 TaxID=2529384 RepID=UPI0012BCE0E1|nr:methyltransferase [Roseibium sp. RKSG952]MTH98774.1 methyltransferase domain-containing protein [Roseibium sp. RKSG952]
MAEDLAITKSADPATPDRLSLRDRVRLLRQRAVGTPAFHRWLRRLPFGRQYANSRAADLLSVMSGFVQSQVLFTLLDTGVLELLEKQPLSRSDLGIRLSIPSDNLRPWLQSAVALEILQELDNGTFTLGDHGIMVVRDPGIEAMIRHHAVLYRDLVAASDLLKSGHHAARLHRFWSYTQGTDVSPEEAGAYSRVMSESQIMLTREILGAVRFDRFRSVLDIGGGTGTFLTALGKQVPATTLHLLDLPAVAEQARAAFNKEGLTARASVHGADFFQDPIPAGHDCYCLTRVLFDHDDAAVMKLLKNVHRAMAPGAKLLIAEPMAGPSKGERVSSAYFAIYLYAMGGGRCRTPQEIRALAETSGFSRTRVIRCGTPMLATVIEAAV